MRGPTAIVLLLIAFGLVAPAAASAGVVRIVEKQQVSRGGSFQVDTVEYVASAGERNRLSLTFRGDVGSEGTVVLRDEAGVVAGEGCTRVADDPRTAECPGLYAWSGEDVVVALGDENDVATGEGVELFVGFDGGGGDDVLIGGDFLARLDGGPGGDELRAGTGRGLMDGGSGPDVMLGGQSDEDSISYADRSEPVVASFDGVRDDGARGEGDTIGPGVEAIGGGAGDDVLLGNGSANELHGGGGDDILRGGDARDWLDGGRGSDRTYGGAGDDRLGDEVSGTRRDSNLLAGGPGDDAISTSAGADRVVPGPGEDSVDGYGGADVVRARDGEFDRVECALLDRQASGVAIVDRDDWVGSCRSVRRSGAPAASFFWLRSPHFALVGCPSDMPRDCSFRISTFVDGRPRARSAAVMRPGQLRLVRLRRLSGTPGPIRGEAIRGVMTTRDAEGRIRRQRRTVVEP